MRLDDDGIAGCQIGEQARVAVPGRERAAAEHEAGAARHDRVALVHRERRVLALRLFPVRVGRECGAIGPMHRRLLRARGPARAGRRPGTPS